MPDSIMHYGTPRRSGRYPWGSGGHEILSRVDALASKGLSETEIANALNMKTTELRNQKALAKAELREAQRLWIVRQKESGMSVSAIAKEASLPPSTVRDLLRPAANLKYRIIKGIADRLKAAISRFGYIDVGDGIEQFLGVSSTKLGNAVTLLKNEGYTVHYLSEEQLGNPGKRTRLKILAAPGTEFKEVAQNKANIQIPDFYTEDKGHNLLSKQPIVNIDSKRIDVRYSEDGGGDRDGLIEIRPGVDDLSLGKASYAQVRIGVDGTHYLKGMAIYNDNLPDGVDIVFHTNKSRADNPGGPLAVLKGQKEEELSPFGAITRPVSYTDENGVVKQSAANIIYEEGDWASFSKSLSSQFLSKQDPSLAKEQLRIAYDRQKAQYDEIMSLENPTVRKHLLQAFSDSCDSEAVVLKAAALPGQATNVLIPIPSLKDDEVYAPNFKNGDRVVNVRYPHGGIFEIPTLTVNNKVPEARKLIGNAPDAIGISPAVAQRLSGADFDGDFVLTIPADRRLKTAPALVGLKDFDPIAAYPPYEGMKRMDGPTKQRLMGDVSNLITDMTIKGATQAEIARAVRHSMVVIDAEKHELNYLQSYKDNGIAALKTRYQGSAKSGASTLVSQSTSQVRVPHRKDNYSIDPETGSKIWTYTNDTYIDKRGREVARLTKTQRGYEVDDAHKLSSGTRIERVYADYANQMKRLGDQARLSLIGTKSIPYSRAAEKTYSTEVASLNQKLNLALRNAPLERKAQIVAGEIYRAKLANNPGMSTTEKGTARGQSINLARKRVGANKPYISFTTKEWEAVQMGAISPTKLSRMLRNADMDQVTELATPRTRPVVPRAKTLRARTLLDMGYTVAEVASSLGLTANQVHNALNED